MKKLLNTLYVTTEDSYLALEGENVLVLKDDATLLRLPLHTLEAILYFGYKGASPALMGACAKRGVRLSFLTPSGRFLAAACGENCGNVVLRREQYRLADDPRQSARIARGFILGKVYNARWMLERAARDHALRVDTARLKQASAVLGEALAQIEACLELESLRGLEGACAERYIDVFDELVLQNKDVFRFDKRSRRPPLDPMNALLSFTYTLLSHDCASALEGVGLDPYVGFLHRDRPGRMSLALDLMEELRGVMAERFCLTLINNRVVRDRDFETLENGAVYLSEKSRKAVLGAWQERKREQIVHPFLAEKMAWGLVPHAQAMLLARYLRGDLDAYPPFFWK